ncbi:Hypothetical predicted protein [Podarcis lilfordi]|uniref:Uncharacterized protein n=1 Tax=Podarcis lilfordi TaxID=74358 RepID=A0AA35PNW2_9SAUR|nr:Hypothetical predicted protein [Podarcis lilfordi]
MAAQTFSADPTWPPEGRQLRRQLRSRKVAARGLPSVCFRRRPPSRLPNPRRPSLFPKANRRGLLGGGSFPPFKMAARETTPPPPRFLKKNQARPPSAGFAGRRNPDSEDLFLL